MKTVLSSLNEALHQSMELEPCGVLIGEDLLDPYGGAFNVTRVLSTRFPDRVISSPISEAGIAGMAAGMAMRGLRPVVEIMFNPFFTLASDMIVNHAAKLRYLSGGKSTFPMVVRIKTGAGFGAGCQFSPWLLPLLCAGSRPSPSAA